MNLLCDESVDGPIVDRLRGEGHTIWYVAEMKKGISDNEVLDLANKHSSILITLDKDFGELVFRRKLTSCGVLLIRLAGLPNAKKAEIVSFTITSYSEQILNAFTVVTEKSVRIRKFEISDY